MSSRGKVGKGLGKGRPVIRHLAHIDHVKRINELIYEETRGILKIFLENFIHDTVTYIEHANHHRHGHCLRFEEAGPQSVWFQQLRT
ncbi:histone h4 [Phtheirospermum japonicum]|uniref:Histone H4 n=1 Tax=Phtheirospermum japonicum TaxID=374723 RepID=A0A830BBL1_9LAMI|nr:histone h4 [Phtheirospermum japonicum]